MLEVLEGWNELNREKPVCLVFFIYNFCFLRGFHGAESTVCVFWLFLRAQCAVVFHGEQGDEGKQTDPAS